MTTIAALLQVTAESGGAATLDRDHGAPPRGRQRRTVPVTEAGPKWRNTSATSSPSWATQPARQVGTRSGTPGTVTSSDSSGLAVAQTLLVAIMRYRAVVLRLR